MRKYFKIKWFQKHLMKVLGISFAFTVPLTMLADDHPIFGKANVIPLKCRESSKQYVLTGGNVPGFLYFKDEPVDLTFKFTRGGDSADQEYAIEIQGVNTRKPNKSKEYIDPYGYPDMLSVDGESVRHPLKVSYGDRKEVEVEVKNLPVPQRYGTYCLILVKGTERILLGSVGRVVKNKDNGTVDNTPIFGEGAIFGGFKEISEASKSYVRMGIRGLRCEGSMRNERTDGKSVWEEFDRLSEGIKAGGMQAMYTLSGVGSQWYDIKTKEQPIPAAVDVKWDRSPYGGNADWGCGVKNFDTYEKWVKDFATRYWENGKGSLWGLENYNEPWEGGGISGYARDCVAYREWQKRMARAAHSVSKDIKICAASSIMNTEDKLFSEGPSSDGKYEMDEYIDVFTDHYVPPYSAYGPMVAKAHGKISIENETWLAISEYLLPQVMCQWMASGQLAVMPFHPNVLFEGLEGSPYKYFCPSTVPVATAAFNHFVTGLRFEKLVFKEHLPWLFQFGKDDNSNGVCILIGQLLTRGGPTPQDNPEGRLWRQVDAVNGGTITIDNSDGALKFFDVAGNEVFKNQKNVTVNLDLSATYIQSAKGPALVAERVAKAKIDGKYPAEIIPHDFKSAINGKSLVLSVDVSNRINRPISGKLNVNPPEGFSVKDNGKAVTLKAGEVKTVEFTFDKVKEDSANQYPFEFNFETDAGKCSYSEVLNCAVAMKKTMKIDGDLSDWEKIPGITVVGKSEGVNPDELARRPWLRLVKEVPKGAVMANIKMAWDDQFIYVAAEVNDSTPQTDKIRMETRNENSYFHNAESDKQEPWKSWLEKNAPGQSFSQVPYIYKKKPFDNSYTGDQLQLGFNVREDWHDLKEVTEVPKGFHAYPDTDYEFCSYLCADGKSELWNILTPDMPRIHGWPHQPMGKVKHNSTPGSVHVVKQQGNVRIYEIAIPKSAIPELALKPGSNFKFTFHVGNNDGSRITYGEKKAVTKMNSLTLHPYWENKPACEIGWSLVE